MHLCVSLLLSLIQCLCACHVTPDPATNWVSPSFSFLSFVMPPFAPLPPPPPITPSYLAAPVSKRSTVPCMECATVCRLYGGDIYGCMQTMGWMLYLRLFFDHLQGMGRVTGIHSYLLMNCGNINI